MSTCIVVDCENIDSVLGFQILGRKPAPSQRTDFAVIEPWFRRRFGSPVKLLLVIREGEGQQRLAVQRFTSALVAMGHRPIFAERYAASNGICPPSSREVVDHVVCDLLARASSDTIVYMGHDFCAAEVLAQQKQKGSHVFACGFEGHFATAILDVVEDVLDLEYDVGAFNQPLPRHEAAIDLDAA